MPIAARSNVARRAPLLASLAGLTLSAAVLAQPTTFYTLDLVSGESLRNVAVVEESGESVTVYHPLLGVITIPRANIASMAVVSSGPKPDAMIEAEQAARAETPPPEPEPEPAADEPKSPWSGYVDLGIAGSEGNTETFAARAAAGVRRETEETIFQINARYRLKTSRGDREENAFDANVRHDWLIPDSPWGFFAEGLFDYDEFKDYDFRIDLVGGVTYEFIKTDTTSLVGRAGAGASREFGGPDDEWKPIAVFGLRFEHEFNDRVKFVAFGDYYPDISDWEDFRVISGAHIEVGLNESGSLVMKAGVQDTYDSKPGNAEKHDLDYYLTLGFKF